MKRKTVKFKLNYLILLLKKEYILSYYRIFFVLLVSFITTTVSLKLLSPQLEPLWYLCVLSLAVLFGLLTLIVQGRICKVAKWKNTNPLISVFLEKIVWYTYLPSIFDKNGKMILYHEDSVAFYTLILDTNNFIIIRKSNNGITEEFDIVDILNACIFNNKGNKQCLQRYVYTIIKAKIVEV